MKDEEAIMDHSMTGAQHAALDHDEFGSNRSKLINVIDSKTLARDSREKPVSTFSHPALSPEDFHAVPRLRRRLSEIRAYGYRPTPARLTGQQLLIAQLTALGLANKEIAYLADISETTVKAHISAALRSLNLKRRTQLCRYVFESRLLGEE